MLFSLLLCYFEGRLRSAGPSSPPPPCFSLRVSSPRSHPTLNQAFCNSRLFILASNILQYFGNFFFLSSLSFCTWPDWKCGNPVLYLSPVYQITPSENLWTGLFAGESASVWLEVLLCVGLSPRFFVLRKNKILGLNRTWIWCLSLIHLYL